MDDVFKKRRSVRRFQKQEGEEDFVFFFPLAIAREIEPEKLKEILEAAHSSPSAGDLKAREIIVIKDKKVREKLAEAALGQDFIAEAPVVLIFFSIGSRSAQKYGKWGKNLYALQDATISASFAWLQAVILGLSGCWVGAFEESRVKDILGIKEDWRPIAILPLGYSME